MMLKKRTALFLALAVLLMSLSGCAVMKLIEGQEQIPSPTPSAAPSPALTPKPSPSPTLLPTPQPTPAESDIPASNPISDRTEEITASMALEEKVGQMFIVRCPEYRAAEDIQAYHIGNLILFGRDFKESTREEVIEKVKSYQLASRLPMLIGVDEEGGEVTRISRYPQFGEERYPSPRDLYKIGGLDKILAEEGDKIAMLKSLGINMNFAPVADIALDDKDYMYSRSLGQPPEITADFVAGITRLYAENGMACAIKHFPGYGNNADTHEGIAVDKRNIEGFEEKDLVPFYAGMDSGMPAVLVSHNIVECFDHVNPASLSPAIHEYIRNTMGFDGVLITDDLTMRAIKNYTDDKAAAVTAIKAGNDLLCCTNYQEQIPAVIEACRNGEISEERIDESVKRILRWKLNLGIIDPNA